MPVMMLSNLALSKCTVTPIFLPTALARSMSKPCSVLPSAAVNSFGG